MAGLGWGGGSSLGRPCRVLLGYKIGFVCSGNFQGWSSFVFYFNKPIFLMGKLRSREITWLAQGLRLQMDLQSR